MRVFRLHVEMVPHADRLQMVTHVHVELFIQAPTVKHVSILFKFSIMFTGNLHFKTSTLQA